MVAGTLGPSTLNSAALGPVIVNASAGRMRALPPVLVTRTICAGLAAPASTLDCTSLKYSVVRSTLIDAGHDTTGPAASDSATRFDALYIWMVVELIAVDISCRGSSSSGEKPLLLARRRASVRR